MIQESQEALDYAYIEELKTKSEKQLRIMLDNIDEEIEKTQAEKARIENKLKETIKKGHFVKDVLMEKWRTPRESLLNAIKEIENGECETYDTVEEAIEAMQED